jgi:hypothetical protein
MGMTYKYPSAKRSNDVGKAAASAAARRKGAERVKAAQAVSHLKVVIPMNLICAPILAIGPSQADNISFTQDTPDAHVSQARTFFRGGR